MKMSSQFLEHQKEVLLAEKERLEKKIKNLKEYPEYGDIGDDMIQELVDYENNMSAEEQLSYVLKKVNLALREIEKGNYGNCKKCGEAIEAGRLKIMPYVDLCVTCKTKK